jgi:hypothetical protein
MKKLFDYFSNFGKDSTNERTERYLLVKFVQPKKYSNISVVGRIMIKSARKNNNHVKPKWHIFGHNCFNISHFIRNQTYLSLLSFFLLLLFCNFGW